MVMTVMNYIWLKRELPFKFLFMRYMIKPLFAGGVMGVFVYYCQLLLTPTIGDRIATFSIILAAGVYALVLVATKGINEDDITLLPKGAVIVRCLKKCACCAHSFKARYLLHTRRHPSVNCIKIRSLQAVSVFLCLFSYLYLTAACAAASLAIGTR